MSFMTEWRKYMNTTSRIMPVQLSRERLDSQTVQARYKAGYGLYMVTNRFGGDKSLCELYYEIIANKQNANYRSGQHA